MIGPMPASSPELSATLGLPGSALEGKNKPSLKDAAQGFESVLLSLLLKEMRKTLEPGSLFGDDKSDVYGGLFDQFMSQHLAQGKGMGLAHSLINQLEPTTTHGASHPPAAKRA
jgi:Rod binding domain-containing protein